MSHIVYQREEDLIVNDRDLAYTFSSLRFEWVPLQARSNHPHIGVFCLPLLLLFYCCSLILVNITGIQVIQGHLVAVLILSLQEALYSTDSQSSQTIISL